VEPNPPSVQWVTDFFSAEYSVRGVKLVTSVLAPKLRAREAIPHFLLHDFLACAGTNIPFFFFTFKCKEFPSQSPVVFEAVILQLVLVRQFIDSNIHPTR